MNGLNFVDVEGIIRLALKEDIGEGDITSRAIFPPDHESVADIISKDNGIFCCGDLALFVFKITDPSVKVEVHVSDGAKISQGDILITMTGKTVSLLESERTLLNFLQRSCGIATYTSRLTELLQGSGAEILDTRKTMPGLRALDKYSVKTGGGRNHRMGLYDMVLIKDNHIKAAGNITQAVNKVRLRYGSQFKVEAEASCVDEAFEAAETGVDIIMLDNMSTSDMRKAIQMIAGRARIEVSGNVDEKRLEELKAIGIDYISMGALTHSVKAFDLSMKIK